MARRCASSGWFCVRLVRPPIPALCWGGVGQHDGLGLAGSGIVAVGGDLCDSLVEDPPSALVLVGEDGACCGQVGGVVDQLGGCVQVVRRGARTGEVLAQRGWCEVDPFHHRDGPPKVPCDELSGASVLPVVADDPVPLA